MATAVGDPETAVAGDAKETAAAGTGAVVPLRRGANRILVSSNKKPVRFYVNLAKRRMQQHNEVVLSAMGQAIGTVVSIAEILKNTGLAIEKSILTSTVESKDESRGRNIHKSKIEILLEKTVNFNDLVGDVKVDDGEEAPEEDHKDL